MTILDYTWLKDTLNTIISDYVSPKQMGYESTLSSTIDYYQFVKPFTSSISTVEFYVSGTFGTPSDVVIGLYETSIGTTGSTLNLSTIKTSTITPSIGWNTLTVNTRNIKSKKEYVFKVDNTGATDYYYLGASTIATPWYCIEQSGNTTSTNLAFKISGSNNLVTKGYPSTTISDDSYPIITTDITGRPRVDNPYIDPRIVEESINYTAFIFSKYVDELDALATLVEKAILKKREKIGGVFIVTPSNVTSISRFREMLMERDVNFSVRMFVKDDS